MLDSNEPLKKCVVCNSEFTSRNTKQVTCGKKECSNKNGKRNSQKQAEQKNQRDFSKGTVYVLDEESWTWQKENRGE